MRGLVLEVDEWDDAGGAHLDYQQHDNGENDGLPHG